MPVPLELLDIFMDADGDIAIGPDGDLLLARNEEVLNQEVRWRLKTTKGDYPLIPSCGANLELLIGRPNSPETGAIMEAFISEALTYDGFLTQELESIKAVPVNREQILALLRVNYGEDSFVSTITLDLKEGVLQG